MFDSRKIDDFFDNETSFLRKEVNDKPPVSGWLRFIKIGFPCVAALLLGVMIVMPNIKKSVDLKDNITVPRKNEMEKLHVEQTVFNITDDKNRVSRITADTIDETEPGSQRIKITSPKGNIPTDQGEVEITSETGYFDQEYNILDLFDNVKAVVDGSTIIETQTASFDFNRNQGYGNENIKAHGNWGNLTAGAFEYDQETSVLKLINDPVVRTEKGVLTAKNKAVFFQNEHKIEAYGEVELTQNSTRLKADKIIAYLNEQDTNKLENVEAFGNVYVITSEQIAYGACGIYDASEGKIILESLCTDQSYDSLPFVEVKQEQNVLKAKKMFAYLTKGEKQQVERVDAFGGVEVVTPKGSAKGDYGQYRSRDDIVELMGNVIIEQDGNFIRGGRAETNLKTSVSKVTGLTKNERINGVFYGKRKAKNEYETK